MKSCFRITYERVNPRTGRPVHDVFGCKVAYSCQAEANARHKTGFLRVVSTERLTPEQYAREFPPGRSSKGRYVLVRA
jgi:hypothetical protein